MSVVCLWLIGSVCLTQMKDLQNYSQKRMKGAVDLGLGSCTLAYIISGIGGYFLFSGHPAEDVLKSFTPANLSPVIGADLASKVEVAVRASYLIVLLCHAPIVSFGLRELLLEIVFKDQDPHTGAHTGTTILIVAASYVASVTIPNVWTFLQITGATAALSLAYVIPAMLMLKLEKLSSQHGIAWLILAGSLITSVTSIVHTLKQAV